jgi:hypothetical protein
VMLLLEKSVSSSLCEIGGRVCCAFCVWVFLLVARQRSMGS